MKSHRCRPQQNHRQMSLTRWDEDVRLCTKGDFEVWGSFLLSLSLYCTLDIICIYIHIFFFLQMYCILLYCSILLYYNIYIMYTTQHPRGFPVHIVSTCHGHSSRRRPWRSLVPPGVPRPPKSWESPARASAINGSPQELWWATSAWGWWNNDIYPLVMSK